MRITTEKKNPISDDLDILSIEQVLDLMNKADNQVLFAVQEVLKQVESAIKLAVDSIKNGGRMIYIGAGSSGRIGVMDAAEIGPTFDMGDRVVGVIAGGDICMTHPNETIEDKGLLGAELVNELNVKENDFVIGLTASGQSEFILNALERAKKMYAKTALITVNDASFQMNEAVDLCINPKTGPEVLVGSTRLKATTAMKMILNMISTITMVQLGRTYKNYMCYIKPCNKKLYDRSVNIISDCCSIEKNKSEILLRESKNQIPIAIIMGITGTTFEKSTVSA